METPVLFIIFKRYDTAQKVFNRIREARPKHLYVAADAPRHHMAGEAADCARTRDIVKQIDWDCELHTLFQTENQGCGIGPAKAITWFFENVEMGIVLEDDCLPHPDFFRYCEEMLVRYKHDESIGLITGRNGFKVIPRQEGSYFLSALHFCWGWASWRRVWKQYDCTLSQISAMAYLQQLLRYFGWWNMHAILWRMNIFIRCKKKQPRDAWDYQFCVSTQMHSQFTIVPMVNMVTNIGFDDRATHTKGDGNDIESHSLYPIAHIERAELKYHPQYDVLNSRSRYSPLRLYYSFLRNLLGF